MLLWTIRIEGLCNEATSSRPVLHLGLTLCLTQSSTAPMFRSMLSGCALVQCPGSQANDKQMEPGLTMDGPEPRHSPLTPPSAKTALVEASMVLWGFALDCIRVFMRSRGFVTPAATPPLMEPAAILRTKEGFSLVTPMASFTGP